MPIFMVANLMCLVYNESMNILIENSIKNICGELEGFRRANNQYNFRCPFCGDSAKSKLKKRGWLFEHKGKVFYKCFNCDKSVEYSRFLKELFPQEYMRYIAEKAFSGDNTYVSHNYNSRPITEITREMFEAIELVKPTTSDNLGGQYLDKRKITNRENFYYTSDYGSLLRRLGLKTYSLEFECHEPRLLIPHFNRSKYLAYIQMRCLNNSKIRYRTYKVIEDEYKLWNLDQVDFNKKIYITEGALDASFLQNSVAMSGSDAQLEKCILYNFKENLRIILDNEPRSPIILQKYAGLIDRGYRVFHWPDIPYKDINEAILANYDIVKDIYNEDNYYLGLQGKLQFSMWKKY